MTRTLIAGACLLLVLTQAATGLAQSEVENSAYRTFYGEQNAQKKAELGEKFLTDFKESTYRDPILKTILQGYYQAQNWAKVMEHAEKFPAGFPKADNATRALVYTYALAGAQSTNNAAKTVEYGDKILAADPNNLQAMLVISTTIPQAMTQDKAANDKALDLSAKALGGVQQYFSQPKPAQMNDAQWKQARVEYEDQLHTARGLIYFNRMDYDKSIEEFQAVVKNTPKDPVARMYMGFAWRTQAADASKATLQAFDAENAAIKARAAQPEIDELVAKRQFTQEDFTTKRDKAIEELAIAVATGDQRVAKQAKEALDALWKTKNNESLDGLDQFIASKK
jgi:tetratricopeptide (TPR) repeat protein